MSEPFLGEIRIFSFNFPPKGWAFCNGQLLPINQNQALFAILGTIYGGNGVQTFALPNLQARVPLHFGAGIVLGQQGGIEAVTLSASQIPVHIHSLSASTDPAVATLPTSAALAKKPRFGADVYAAPATETSLHPESIGSIGGSQPHENMQPFLVLNFAIALQGIFPTQN
ncbi:MAG TPA: phage tail protein [Deltaproteobacteria bacterium]|jgi:microcystin-dependent protein|nr:phage tail protein [Deltaproteobacteria bacterium]